MLGICTALPCLSVLEARVKSMSIPCSVLELIEAGFTSSLSPSRLSLTNYEGTGTKRVMKCVTLQPLVTDHANAPHIEAMDVSFHMGYGGPVCSKRLLGDRPKCKRMLANPGEYQNMIIKYLSVGLQS